jgi:hypothetical protein
MLPNRRSYETFPNNQENHANIVTAKVVATTTASRPALTARTLDSPDVTGCYAFLPNTIGHTAGSFSVQTVPIAG